MIHDAGLAAVLVSWAGGLAALLALLGSAAEPGRDGSASRRPDPRPALDRAAFALTTIGALGVVTSLALPWVTGRAAGTGEPLTLSGWEGLDPLTVGMVVALAVVAAALAARPDLGGGRRPIVARSSGWCAVGLLVGNATMQATLPTGSRLDRGAAISLVAALVLLAGTERLRVSAEGRTEPRGPREAGLDA